MIAAIYPRTLLVMPSCLLALATSTSAECAWVLWAQEVGSPLWETLEGFEKKTACDAGLSKAEAPASRLASTAKKPRLLTLQCLPDTVDPRK